MKSNPAIELWRAMHDRLSEECSKTEPDYEVVKWLAIDALKNTNADHQHGETMVAGALCELAVACHKLHYHHHVRAILLTLIDYLEPFQPNHGYIYAPLELSRKMGQYELFNSHALTLVNKVKSYYQTLIEGAGDETDGYAIPKSDAEDELEEFRRRIKEGDVRVSISENEKYYFVSFPVVETYQKMLKNDLLTFPRFNGQ